ncbi:hypothetical protein [Paraburkholderia phenoliruptrix]|uniref:hypothetical protein n=1 Tax=Paraburkholderia phenoliruptrix TaxID=252970 RepID=UPI003D979D6F
MNTDQANISDCESCGTPLTDPAMPCPSCRARRVPAYGAMVPTLTVRLNDSRAVTTHRVPARRVWNPSHALTNPYASTQEPVVVQSAYQRLREPVAFAASALVVASAVYVGFIHHGDSELEGEPVAVSGAIRQQHVAPPVAAVERAPAMASVQSAAVAPAPRAETASTPPTALAAAQPPIAAALPPTSASRLPARRAAPAVSAVSSAVPIASGVAIASAQAKRNPGAMPLLTAEEKARVDLSRHLRAARASLQNNNLSATKVRIAAAMSVQPQSREAQSLRAAVTTREQQRDALLNLARGCNTIARWDCVSRNAGSALEIDSSSREARRLVTLAMQETALATVQTAAPEPEPAPDTRDVNAHH